MMYQIDIAPGEVQHTLANYLLADGYDMTFDMERSHDVTIYDSKYQRDLLDFFTCFASVPLGYNPPQMVNDNIGKASCREIVCQYVSISLFALSLKNKTKPPK